MKQKIDVYEIVLTHLGNLGSDTGFLWHYSVLNFGLKGQVYTLRVKCFDTGAETWLSAVQEYSPLSSLLTLSILKSNTRSGVFILVKITITLSRKSFNFSVISIHMKINAPVKKLKFYKLHRIQLYTYKAQKNI